ncbi:hypothetical protein ACHHYP_15653 [Achlya hypogyna]|uniref:DUF4349 domain-containing protein n=1 Tax=Achlya hypogyna TaxID=1202772 RepID=A0A1V9YAB4_ACHHY|nr:hypothetical protein ACHHYP_15653 [Achlya hypogyna]
MQITCGIYAAIFLLSFVHGVVQEMPSSFAPGNVAGNIPMTTKDIEIEGIGPHRFFSSEPAGFHAKVANPAADMLVWDGHVTVRADDGHDVWTGAKVAIRATLLKNGLLENEAEEAMEYALSTLCQTITKQSVPCPPEHRSYSMEARRTWSATWRGEDFHGTMDEIMRVPNTTVVSKQASRADVAPQYEDAVGRSATLLNTRTALEKLLEQAGNVNEIAGVVSKIQEVTEKIEAAEREALWAATAVRLSTIRVRLEERHAANPIVVVDCEGWTLAKTIRRAVVVLERIGILAADGAVFAVVLGTPILLGALMALHAYKLLTKVPRYDRIA